ncbi:MAG: hypothetical protein IJS14_03355 [Lentisphaeria bacterium]|nr:hypothetical protein [Lentisphaeria bacterium]
MIHEEKSLPFWSTVFILILAFLLTYPLWKLGLRDIFWDEGEYAAILAELDRFPPAIRAHGEFIPGFYPLYPLFVKGILLTGASMEFSLRFISVAALAGLTVMVGVIGWRMAGVRAGAMSAAVMFTTLITAEKAVEGYPNTLTVLLIFSGSLLWFYLGQFGGSWNLGWLSTGLFAGLAFYCGGWTALVYFLVPMMFQKRPFTPWRRFDQAGFPGGVLILLFFILLWLIPNWAADCSSLLYQEGYSVWDYLLHILETAVDIPFRLLPWTFFLYAPFCPALIVLDKNPLFSKYLRTLFVVTAVLLVLNPFSRARDIMYLLPAFSLLAGLNYDIVVRRHGTVMCKVLRWTAVGVFCCSVGIFIFRLAPVSLVRELPILQKIDSEPFLKQPMMTSLAEISAAILLSVGAYLMTFRQRTVWLITLMLFTAGMLCFSTVITPRKAAQRSRSETGKAFRKAIGSSFRPDMTVYKDDAISGLYTECHYLGAPVRTILFTGTGDLKEKEVYLLSPSSIQPPDVTRTWTRTMDVIYKKKNLYMWKGILNDRENGPENDYRNMRF